MARQVSRSEAICEATTQRRHVRVVPIKGVEQQVIQALHRLGEQVMRWSTALINQKRPISMVDTPVAVRPTVNGRHLALGYLSPVDYERRTGRSVWLASALVRSAAMARSSSPAAASTWL